MKSKEDIGMWLKAYKLLLEKSPPTEHDKLIDLKTTIHVLEWVVKPLKK